MPKAQDSVGVHFLHIGKTGGMTIKATLRKHNLLGRTPSGIRLAIHSHSRTMYDVLARDEKNQVVFFLRHPVRRFVSGFNSRLREGAPERTNPWKPGEAFAFGNFPTPNDLAEALSAEDPITLDRAYAAMEALTHAKPFTYWLRDVDYLNRRIDRIAFVGFQETYAEDVTRFLEILGASADVDLEHRHQAPSTSSTELSELAEKNLERWYADDMVIYSWALERRARWASDPA